MGDRERIRQVWGVIIGGLVGVFAGLILIVWGTLFEMETRFRAGYTSSIGTPIWLQIIQHPWSVLTAMLLSMGTLGFLFAFTTAGPRICMACGKPNPVKGKVCQYCGTTVNENKESMVCPSCHETYSESSRFCPLCAVELVTMETTLATRKSSVKTCPSCGATNLPQRSECHSCAHQFDQ